MAVRRTPGTSAARNNDAFVVLGGAPVSVNDVRITSAPSWSVRLFLVRVRRSLTLRLFNPTGNVTITNGAVVRTTPLAFPTVFTNGATTVDIVGNAGTIADVNSFCQCLDPSQSGVSTLSSCPARQRLRRHDDRLLTPLRT